MAQQDAVAYVYLNSGVGSPTPSKDATAQAYENVGIPNLVGVTVYKQPVGWGVSPVKLGAVSVLQGTVDVAVEEAYEYVVS